MPYDAIVDYQNIQFDERGAPYWMTQSGKRDYLPPLSAMTSRNPRAVEWARSMGVYQDANGQVVNQSAPGSSFLHNRGEWDPNKGEWHQGINWNNILAVGVGAMIGAPVLASAFGGPGAGAAAGAQAGGDLASTSIPASLAMNAVPGAIASQGASAGVPLAAGLGGALPSSSIPVSTAMSGPAAIASPGASAGGSSLLSNVLKGLKDYGPSALAGVGAAKNLLQGPPPASQDLERILALIEGRVNATQPLFDSLNTMTQAQLPAYSRKS